MIIVVDLSDYQKFILFGYLFYSVFHMLPEAPTVAEQPVPNNTIIGKGQYKKVKEK